MLRAAAVGRRRRRYQLTIAELVHTPFVQSIHASEAAAADADEELGDVIQ